MGAAYMLFQDVLLEGSTLTAPHVVGGILFFGLVRPMFASFTLMWAGRAAVAEAEAQKETRRRARQLKTASQVSQRITAILDVDGLVPALKSDTASFQEQHQISCSVQVSGEQIRFSPEIEIAAYRIA